MNPGLTAGEALGNRFLLVEASGLEGADPSALARERCGDGDGLLVMGSEGPEARTVEIWNRDGSAGGACLNGLRVAALWLGGEEGAFLMAGHRVDWRRIGQEVELRIPASSLPATKNFEVLQVSGLDGLRVPFWNPHAVFAVDDPDAVDLGALAAETRRLNHLFPDGVNVEIVGPETDGRVSARVDERGVGETGSCGSGAVAILLAAGARGFSGPLQVVMRGGILILEGGPEGWISLRGGAAVGAEASP